MRARSDRIFAVAPAPAGQPMPASSGDLTALDARHSLKRIAVLIPAWQPDGRLVGLVRALLDLGFGQVIVIDDGSPQQSAAVFKQLGTLPHTRVLQHARNRGKGRALKTGFAALLNSPASSVGVVTCDADGQHLPTDVARVGRTLVQAAARPVLGVRRFSGHNVPLRSLVGNVLTRWLFCTLTGCAVSDTQTGLRGLPLAVLPTLVDLPGERYEYETNMLAYLCHSGPAPLEVQIATVYLEHNRTSHFRPISDSTRIYAALLRVAARRLFFRPGAGRA